MRGMTLPPFLSSPFRFAVPAIVSFCVMACGGGGSDSADAGLSANSDASSEIVPDATTALPDAMISTADAMPAKDLSDVVDEIADGALELGDLLCACDNEFCGQLTITAMERECMQAAIAGLPYTAELEAELLCASQGLSDALACAGAQSCDLDAIFSCLDSAPACLDSPLFSDEFDVCLSDGDTSGTPPSP